MIVLLLVQIFALVIMLFVVLRCVLMIVHFLVAKFCAHDCVFLVLNFVLMIVLFSGAEGLQI